MSKNANLFAALIFIGTGIFLIIYYWPPGKAALLKDQAKVVQIVKHPATRYNVKIITSDGKLLSCRQNALRGWPPNIINTCPIKKFYPLIGKSVTVLHDGRFIYSLKSDKATILSYSAFRMTQILMSFVALIMIGIGLIWLRKT
jgi:hypothetical protein